MKKKLYVYILLINWFSKVPKVLNSVTSLCYDKKLNSEKCNQIKPIFGRVQSKKKIKLTRNLPLNSWIKKNDHFPTEGNNSSWQANYHEDCSWRSLKWDGKKIENIGKKKVDWTWAKCWYPACAVCAGTMYERQRGFAIQYWKENLKRN